PLVHIHARRFAPTSGRHGTGARRWPAGGLFAMRLSGRTFLGAHCYLADDFSRVGRHLLATMGQHILARIRALAALGKLFLLVAWSKFVAHLLRAGHVESSSLVP